MIPGFHFNIFLLPILVHLLYVFRSGCFFSGLRLKRQIPNHEQEDKSNYKFHKPGNKKWDGLNTAKILNRGVFTITLPGLIRGNALKI
jgi:hypothetical protein